MKLFQVRDKPLIGLALAATAVGLVFIVDAGYPRSIAKSTGTIPPEARSQIVYLAVGLAIGAAVSCVRSGWWKRWALVLWIVSFLTLLIPHVPGWAHNMNGADRWFKVGPVQVQPSEFAKVAMVLFLAAALAGRKAWPRHIKPAKSFAHWLDKIAVPKVIRFAPAIFVLGAVWLIEREPDLGTAAVLAAVAGAMFLVGGVSRKSLTFLGLIAVAGAVLMTWAHPYRLERFELHGSRWEQRNMDDTGYQTVQSELGLAIGGFTGVGLGNGRTKHVMPAPTTDFVMATVGEETGLVGSLIVLAVLGGLVWRMLWLAQRAPTPFASLVLTGFASWIGIQCCVNFMMANGSLPPIGIPLAFVSSGGSSLVALWIVVGLCQSVLEPVPAKEESVASDRYRWGNGRPRLSST